MPLANGQYRVTFPVVQKLSASGFEDGSNTNFNADYSVTPEDAIFQAPAGLIVTINSLQISVTDTGAFSPTEYGNIGAGLTNGILTVIEFNGVEVTNTNQTINDNNELFSTDSLAQIIDYGSNQRTLISRFNFIGGVTLNGDTLDKFILRLNDNMSTLQVHEFVVFGSA